MIQNSFLFLHLTHRVLYSACQMLLYKESSLGLETLAGLKLLLNDLVLFIYEKYLMEKRLFLKTELNLPSETFFNKFSSLRAIWLQCGSYLTSKEISLTVLRIKFYKKRISCIYFGLEVIKKTKYLHLKFFYENLPLRKNFESKFRILLFF